MTRYLFICFVSLLAFVACKNEPEDITSKRGSSQIIHVHIDEAPQVRVALNGVDLRWTAGDNLRVYEITPSGTFSRVITYKIVESSITEDGKGADFSGDQMVRGYKYVAYYGSHTSLSDGAILLQLSDAVQQGTSLEHINNAINLSSDILTYDGLAPLDFKFRHLSTILEFNLKLAPSVVGECRIAGIDFFAPGKPLCSQYTIDPKGDIAVGLEQVGSVQNLQISGVPSLSNSIWFKAQMACLWSPTVATVSNNFIITVRTTDGREATITRPAKGLRSGVIYYINEEITPVDLVARDKQALVAFYHATNGNSWTNKTNWCGDKPLSEWQGVTTHPNSGRVTGILLSNNNLSGHIPPEIGLLSELSFLWVAGNRITDGIPPEIGNLVKLNGFELQYNNLTGVLPAELSKVEQLGDRPNSFNVSHNRLSGKIPDACLAYKHFANWVLTPQQPGYGFADDLAIKLDVSRKDVPSSASTFNVQVSSNQNWTMQNVPSWITFNPSLGNGNQLLTATCQANTTFSERSATITFAAGAYTAILTIVQSGQNASISLDINSKEVSSESNSFNVAVTANTNWTVSGKPDWITLNPSSGTGSRSINVSCAANTVALAREATITFTAGGSSTSLYVKQAGAIPTISLDRSSWNVDGIQGSFTIKVTTNGGAWSVTDVPEWLSLSPNTGTGNQEVTVTHQVNPIAKDRYATLIFQAGGASAKYELRQSAGQATISLDKPTITIGGAAYSFDLTVTTNDSSWSTTNIPSWVQLSDSNFANSKTITVSCSENMSFNERTATVTFRAGWRGGETTLTIIQAGGSATIKLSTTQFSVSQVAGSSNISVTTNGAAWSAVSDADWLSMSPDSGSGSQMVQVLRTANTVAVERSAKVLFTAGNASKELVVRQYAASGTISIDKQSWAAGAGAESTEVNISTNQAKWSTSNCPSWVSVSPANGTGSGKVVVSCLENTSVAQRTASIRFELLNSFGGDDSSYKMLQITQQGQYTLTVNTPDLKFKGEASSQNFSMTSNTSWTATKDQDWFTISSSGGSSTSRTIAVRVSENPDNTPRSGIITITAGTGAGQVVKTVNITQYVVPMLSVASQSFFAPFWVSSYNVAFESNTFWSTTSDQNWCSVSPSSGSGNGSLTISVIKNTSSLPRTAIITLTAGAETQGLVTRTITIKQNPNNDFSIGDWTDNGDHGGDAQ